MLTLQPGRSNHIECGYGYHQNWHTLNHEEVMSRSPKLIPCTLEPLKIDDFEFIFKKDHHGQPVVISKRQKNETLHHDLASLLSEVPEINNEKYLVNLAILANFLTYGEDYEFIDNPDKFKQEYKEQIEREENSFELPAFPLLSYGKINVDEVSPPHVTPGKGCSFFIFYVKKRIPHKVICEFPICSRQPHLKYVLLEGYE